MLNHVHAIFIVSCISMVGCHTKNCDNGYSIPIEAKAGCRSPTDTGCSQCCTPQPSGCLVRSWASGGISGTVTPWYNHQSTENSCPPGCMPCAQCSNRDEVLICQLLLMPNQCDCSLTQSGVDSCRDPASCECYCADYKSLSSSCPSKE